MFWRKSAASKVEGAPSTLRAMAVWACLLIGMSGAAHVDAAIVVSKRANPASGTAVSIGVPLHTLDVVVTDVATDAPVVLTDTISEGLTLGVLPAGCAVSGQVVTCTLAAGRWRGQRHPLLPLPGHGQRGGGDPGREPRGHQQQGMRELHRHPSGEPGGGGNKRVDPASGTAVAVGDVITYWLEGEGGACS